MPKSDYIDVNLISGENVQAIAQYLPYFSDGSNRFYSVSHQSMNPYEYSDVVRAFIRDLYENNFIQPFNWVSWRESLQAQNLFNHPDNLLQASLEDLVKTLIVILRSDRFIGGQLASHIKDGFIANILRRMIQLHPRVRINQPDPASTDAA